MGSIIYLGPRRNGAGGYHNRYRQALLLDPG